MLWEQRFAPLIADGSVTVTFRRWRRRQALAGRRYRTPGGIIEVDDIDEAVKWAKEVPMTNGAVEVRALVPEVSPS